MVDKPETVEDEFSVVPSEQLISQLDEMHAKTGDEAEPRVPPTSIANDFLQIASGAGAIVEPQNEWIGESGILNVGFPTGIVLQEQYNKAWRQATAFIRALGWQVSQPIAQGAIDDGNSEKLWRQFYESLLISPTIIANGTDAYTTPYTYNLTWTSPPKDGTQILLWIQNTNTTDSPTLNFMGTGVHQILHIDGTRPRPGDLSGFMQLVYVNNPGFEAWYIVNVNIRMLVNRIGNPTTVTSATTVYISLSGNDTTGDGTAALPWRTLQHAYNRITSQFYNQSGVPIIIQMADGTYTSGLNAISAPLGTTKVIIQGNLTNPALVRVSVTGGNCFTASGNGNISVKNVSMAASTVSGVGGAAIGCQLGAQVDIINVIFETCGYAHIFCTTNSTVTVQSTSYQVIGGAPTHYDVTSGGTVVASGSQSGDVVVVTLNGTLNFTNCFAQCSGGSFLYAPTNTYTVNGSVTGVRFVVFLNGVIDTAGKGANYFPGNQVGQVFTGGQYA